MTLYRSVIWRSVIWLVAALLTVFVGYASAVIVKQVKAPAQALQLGLWRTGKVEANFAYAAFATRQGKDPKAVLSGPERRLAEHAYRTEPLSAAALGLILMSMPEPQKGEARQRLLDLAGRLTRRNSIITSASIEAAARADDKKAFFVWLSRAILTDNKLRSTYVSAMADATALEGSVEALAPVLGQNPDWAGTYWRIVATRPNSLENAASLRIVTLGAPWRQTEIGPDDRNLAMRLAQAGRFAATGKLAAAFETGAGPASSAGANLLTNGDFVRQPLLPPIDWALATSGQLGASIDDKARRMTISAIGGTYGWAARQLVELSPGNYELAWSMESQTPIDRGALVARLACAERGAAMIPPVPLATGAHRGGFAVPDDGCRWFWFSIDARVGDDSAGFDAVMRGLSLSHRPS